MPEPPRGGHPRASEWHVQLDTVWRPAKQRQQQRGQHVDAHLFHVMVTDAPAANPRVAVRCYHSCMALDERDLFTEKPEIRPGRYQCIRCRRTAEYGIRWIRRSKKDRLPAGASEEDRAKFAKARNYLLRLDDQVTCKACGKRFEIPSQHSLMIADQFAGLPNEEELEREISAASGEPEPEPAPDVKPALPARFTRKSTGWK